MSLADLRKEYMLRGLSESDLDADPFNQFGVWFNQALSAGVPEPNAMSLATATPSGRPSVRMVLLKGFDSHGFIFYSNYESRKGRELSSNPWAAFAIHWVALERQVRAEGAVERLSVEQSLAYFQSRPQGSQLSATASPQSQVIPDRGFLEQRVRLLEEQYGETPLPLPDNWGGYLIVPELIEFWQGRPNRLHDRLRYQHIGDSSWSVERLAP